jgi:hypothetical protein
VPPGGVGAGAFGAAVAALDGGANALLEQDVATNDAKRRFRRPTTGIVPPGKGPGETALTTPAHVDMPAL